MTRYTFKHLEDDIAGLNDKLEKLGDKMRFGLSTAYNRTELNLGTPEQLARHCRYRVLESGTPRECLTAAQGYVVSCV